MVRVGWLIVLAIACGAPQRSQSPAHTALASVVDSLADHGWFTGGVVIRRDGRVVGEHYAGLANREAHVPITSRTRFYVASVTKSVTAAAILMLRDQHALDLDDPIAKFIPEFPRGSITIRQLLTHTSGFAHPVFFPDFYDLARRSYTAEEAVRLFADREPAGEPGQTRYSDYNYVVLARIIEIASHDGYAAFIAKRIFEPLGLGSAGNHASWATIVDDRATGYQPVGLTAFENAKYFDYSIVTGAASIYMSAADLAHWVEALATGKVLSATSTTELVGLLRTKDIAGHHAISLDGWDNIGFGANAVYLPDDKLAIAVVTNQNISGMAPYVAEALGSTLLGIDRRPEVPASVKPDPNRFAGTYRFGSDFYVPGQEMVLVVENGELYEHQKNPDRMMGLIPMTDGSFIYRSHWQKVTFEERDGRITALTFGAFKAARM